MKRIVEIKRVNDKNSNGCRWSGSILAGILFISALAVIFIPEMTWQWGGALALGLFLLIPIFSFLSKTKPD
jgi:hypothetical protein